MRNRIASAELGRLAPDLRVSRGNLFRWPVLNLRLAGLTHDPRRVPQRLRVLASFKRLTPRASALRIHLTFPNARPLASAAVHLPVAHLAQEVVAAEAVEVHWGLAAKLLRKCLVPSVRLERTAFRLQGGCSA